MKQVIQNVRDGMLSLVDLAAPAVQQNRVLIANRSSLISAGTEKMLMQFANKGLLAKAKERPDQVKRVLEKVQTDGVIETYRQVKEKLDQPLGLGYSSAGVVVDCGDAVQRFKVGDRVASNGPHASVVSVPENLVARIPDNVDFDRASFAVLGSIAMQGVRLSRCTLGETVFVIGLGLVGQAAVGLLHAAGCRVIGTDPDPSKCELAIRSGAEIATPGLTATQISELSGGIGADAVLITASTSSNGPIDLACEAVRQKGRIVLVGVVGMEMPRRPMYFKEAEFVVSCSYGPGRYDANYEDRGIDYPAAHVRWTEQRNIQAVLDLMGRGQIGIDHLISHRFTIDDAENAYQMIREGSEPFLGVVLKYPSANVESDTEVAAQPLHSNLQACIAPEQDTPSSSLPTKTIARRRPDHKPRIGVLGVGNFATMTMLPAIRRSQAFTGQTLCSAGGLSASHACKKFGFESATSSVDEIYASPDIDAVFVLTRHDLHAQQIVAGLDAGKHVFVEKPLALSLSELAEIEQAVTRNPRQILTVGFNRRFSQAARIARKHFESTVAPVTIQYRFNAGAIPADSWVQNIDEGGGRIVGEACHAIDLVTYLAGSQPVEIHATSVGGPNAPEITDDQCILTLRHANGSISSIGYFAGGDRSQPKERVEIFGGGRSCVIDDYKQVLCYRGGKLQRTKTKAGKGHLEEVLAFAQGIESEKWPIAWQDLASTTVSAIAAVRSLRSGTVIRLDGSLKAARVAA
ncbi:Glucose--fructose oxidoreductase precursor [Rosistilla oblonga]|uniref:Glucose--fructose oxidoreductase n=2 Tax=Rosistilla oblonga TaxID=2527990 RepID=A0A518IQ78_9BACT|nr:Glucose--fructose oxidoreductase precursor [Rosistilla oblonga]